jgi:hypothetical protein
VKTPSEKSSVRLVFLDREKNDIFSMFNRTKRISLFPRYPKFRKTFLDVSTKFIYKGKREIIEDHMLLDIITRG